MKTVKLKGAAPYNYQPNTLNTGITKWKSDGSNNPFDFDHEVTLFCDTSTDKCAHFDDLSTQYDITCLRSGMFSSS